MVRTRLLSAEHVTKHFPITRGTVFERTVGAVHAVDDVTFELYRSETLGLVGESGCGKSTLGFTIAQLYRATSGHIYYDGVDLTRLSEKELRFRRRRMQLIFQDPNSSLDPRMKIGAIVGEPLRILGLRNRARMRTRIEELLALVQLDGSLYDRYPHELSGGQRQRVGIARALALEPELIICDEPVSALDVSIQAQVINLLEDLRIQLGLTYLFIAHDVSAVMHISERIAVMYLGTFVELGECSELDRNPLHPYTQALFSAVPVADPDAEESRKQIVLKGEVPSSSDPPTGCRFRTRCPIARAICEQEIPAWREIGQGHYVACHVV